MNVPSRRLSALSVAALACLGVGLTTALQHGVAPRIIGAQQAAQTQFFLSVLPSASYDNQPLQHPLNLPERTPDTQAVVAGYLATLEGQPSAVVFQSRTQGYSDAIELLIAVSSAGKLLGVQVLRQNETPGLGARIVTEPGWLANFLGKSLDEPTESAWVLKKDNGQIDQIAGATITSRATINAIQQTLRFFDGHRAQLLSSPVGNFP